MASNFSLDKSLEHFESSVRLVRRNHVSCSIDNIESKSVVLSDPSFQTASGVQNWLFLGGLLPSNSFDVLFSFNVWHLGIDIACEKQDFKACLFETLKKTQSAGVLLKSGPNFVTAALPQHLWHVQLSLDFLVVEEERNAIFVWTAAGLSFHLIVKFLIEGTVPVSSARLSVGRWLRSIADANAVVRIDASGGLNRINDT